MSYCAHVLPILAVQSQLLSLILQIVDAQKEEVFFPELLITLRSSDIGLDLAAISTISNTANHQLISCITVTNLWYRYNLPTRHWGVTLYWCSLSFLIVAESTLVIGYSTMWPHSPFLSTASNLLYMTTCLESFLCAYASRHWCQGYDPYILLSIQSYWQRRY